MEGWLYLGIFIFSWAAWIGYAHRQRMAGIPKYAGGFIVGVVLVALAGVVVPKLGTLSQAEAPQLSIGHKLAIVDAGHMLAASDPAVVQAEGVLKIVADHLHQPEATVADKAVAARDFARQRGVNVTALDILEAVDEIALHVRVPDTEDPFEQSASVYVTLRASGMGHDEAIRGYSKLADKINLMAETAHK